MDLEALKKIIDENVVHQHIDFDGFWDEMMETRERVMAQGDILGNIIRQKNYEGSLTEEDLPEIIQDSNEVEERKQRYLKVNNLMKESQRSTVLLSRYGEGGKKPEATRRIYLFFRNPQKENDAADLYNKELVHLFDKKGANAARGERKAFFTRELVGLLDRVDPDEILKSKSDRELVEYYSREPRFRDMNILMEQNLHDDLEEAGVDQRLIHVYDELHDRLLNQVSLDRMRLNCISSELYPSYAIGKNQEVFDTLYNEMDDPGLKIEKDAKIPGDGYSVIRRAMYNYNSYRAFGLFGLISEGPGRNIAHHYGYENVNKMLKEGAVRIMPEGKEIKEENRQSRTDVLVSELRQGRTVLVSDLTHKKNGMLLRMDENGRLFFQSAPKLSAYWPIPEKPEKPAEPRGIINVFRRLFRMKDPQMKAYEKNLEKYNRWVENKGKEFLKNSGNPDPGQLDEILKNAHLVMKTAIRNVNEPIERSEACSKLRCQDLKLSDAEKKSLIEEAEREIPLSVIKKNLKRVDTNLKNCEKETGTAIKTACSRIAEDRKGYVQGGDSMRELRENFRTHLAEALAGWMTRETARSLSFVKDDTLTAAYVKQFIDQLQGPNHGMDQLAQEIRKNKALDSIVEVCTDKDQMGRSMQLMEDLSKEGGGKVLEDLSVKFLTSVTEAREKEIREAKILKEPVSKETIGQKMTGLILSNREAVLADAEDRAEREACLQQIKAYRKGHVEDFLRIESEEKPSGSGIEWPDKVNARREALAGITAGHIIFKNIYNRIYNNEITTAELKKLTDPTALDAQKEKLCANQDFCDEADHAVFSKQELKNLEKNDAVVPEKISKGLEAAKEQKNPVDGIFKEANANVQRGNMLI